MPQNVTQQTTVQELPTWMRDPLVRMIGTGEKLASEPYPLYPGERVAGFTPDTQSAFGAMRGAAGVGQSNLGIAGLMANQGAMTLPQSNISQYMNPFMSAAIDPAAREIDRRHDQNISSIGSQAAMNNAFGGSRATLLETEANRNHMEEIGDLYARGLSSAYQQGVQTFGEDQARLLEGARVQQGLGELTQAMGLRGADALRTAGLTQEAKTQERLDTSYSDFLEQRDWPYGQLSYLSSLIRGVPQIGTTATTTSQPSPDRTLQYLGAGISGLGVLGQSGIL